MLDMKFIRENTDIIRETIKNKREKADIDKLLDLDNIRRDLIKKTDTLKATKNKASKEISQLKKEKKDATEILNEMKKIAEEEKVLSAQLKKIEKEIKDLLLWIPNIPNPNVPIGDETHNKIIKEWGTIKNFSFTPKDHTEIGKITGALDLQRGAKVAGSFFPLYRGIGAKLERALINFMMDTHSKNGYEEILPPYLNNAEALHGTGQLPKLKDDMYYIEKDDLFLDPTAEVPVTNMYAKEILQEKELPMQFVAYTACFRREAGSYGKETKGLMRLHQFNKVELVKITTPEKGYEEFEKLLQDAENILQMLELPYRVILLSTGDMTFASAMTYDIEVFAPGLDKWLEVSSVSIFETFQSRRMNLRYRTKDGKMAFPYTMNGSGLATPRLFIAILENYQKEDGTFEIPTILKKYM